MSSRCMHRAFSRLSSARNRLLSSRVAASIRINQHDSDSISKSVRNEHRKTRLTVQCTSDFAEHRNKIAASTSSSQILDVLKSETNLDITVYTSAIRQCGTLKDINCCCHIMDSIKHRNLTPTLITFSTLFHALKLNQRMDLCDRYLNEMINIHHISPNIIVANTLLSGCVSKGDVHRAQDIWNRIILKYALEPDIATLKFMVEIYGQNGNVNAARKYYDEMISNPTMTVDIRVHTVMMRAYIENNDIENALEIKQKVETSGTRLDAIGYIPFISFYLKPTESMNPRRALKLIKECIAVNRLTVIPERVIHLKFVALKHLMAMERDEVKRERYWKSLRKQPRERMANGLTEWDGRSAKNVVECYLIYFDYDLDDERIITFFEGICHHIGYWNRTSIDSGGGWKWTLDLHGYSYDLAKFVLHYLMTRKQEELINTMGYHWEIICGNQGTARPMSRTKEQSGLKSFLMDRLENEYGIRSQVSHSNTGKIILNEEDVRSFVDRFSCHDPVATCSKKFLRLLYITHHSRELSIVKPLI